MTSAEMLELAASRGAWVTRDRLENISQLCKRVRDVPGCFVECGVARGTTATVLAWHAVEQARTLELFDTFSGLPPAGEIDRELQPRSDWDSFTGRCCGTLEEIIEHFKRFPTLNVVMHPGLFQDTLPLVDRRITLLHADGDWYESTQTILKYLAPQVVPGGIIVVDDYGHWKGCQKAVSEWFNGDPEPHIIHCGNTQVWWAVE